MTDTSPPFFPVYVWITMFSCCLQKQKAVCPLHYLTPLHFRSTVGEKLKDIVPPPSQKWPKSLAISLIVILFVLNALTSLQAERVVAIVRFTRFYVCAVHISTQRLSTPCSFITGFCSQLPLLSFPFSPVWLFFSVHQLQIISACIFFSIVLSMRTVLHVFFTYFVMHLIGKQLYSVHYISENTSVSPLRTDVSQYGKIYFTHY